MPSPYDGVPVQNWRDVTLQLIKDHPLDPDEIYDVVHQVWRDIFQSGIGSKPFKIGVDLFPRPQIMGSLLHELIPLEFIHLYPELWRREQTTDDKDLVYMPDNYYSVEIKTSSSAAKIYGNRSYAQEGKSSKKDKSGYFLAINFEKFAAGRSLPQVTAVRFGWLDHMDWLGQTAATGQQARLSPDAERLKLLKLPLE